MIASLMQAEKFMIFNATLSGQPAKRFRSAPSQKKNALIKEIEELIAKVYQLDF